MWDVWDQNHITDLLYIGFIVGNNCIKVKTDFIFQKFVVSYIKS